MRLGIGFSVILLLLTGSLNAAGPVLNDAKSDASMSHFRAIYEFSNQLDPKNIKVRYINSTIQIDVVGGETYKDKKFFKVKDPMVRTLYSFKSDRDTLSLRINYDKKFPADDLVGRVDTKVEGKNLIVSVADGRAVKLGNLDKMLLKPDNLNEKKVEDKFRYLQKKFNPDDQVAEEKILPAKLPAVLSVDQFEKKLADKLKYDNSDRISDKREPAKVRRNEGPIKIKRIKDLKPSENGEVLMENEVTSKKPDSSSTKPNYDEMNESEIPVFSAATTGTIKEKKSSGGNLAYALIVVLGIGAVSMLALKFYGRKKKTENKHTSIKVLTQHHLGPRKSLAIVRVAGESILVGITDNSINHIKTLHLLDEEIPMETPRDFGNTLSSQVEREQGMEDIGLPLQFQEEEEEEDEYSVRGIKDMVTSRMRGMREL
ncbi:MAG: FliO/MopB family protein [Bdellovibrionales bacterium]